MKRKQVLISLAAVVLVTVIAGLRFSNSTRDYNPALVDPNLTMLKEPFQKVLSSYELTGNTIAIEIVDISGQGTQFTLQGRAKGLASYPRVTVGEGWQGGQMEVKNPEDTKLMLINILAKYPSPQNDECAALLRRGITATPRVLWWRWKLYESDSAGSQKTTSPSKFLPAAKSIP